MLNSGHRRGTGLVMEREITTEEEMDETIGGLTDDELTYRFKEAIRIDDEIRRIKGLPVARYDMARRQSYLEYPDGKREYREKT